MFLSLSQLESLLQLWLTLSLNTCTGASEESGSDIFLFNASRVPTIPLNQGPFHCVSLQLQSNCRISHISGSYINVHLFICRILQFSASISSFLTVLAWYPNTSLRTWCLVLHSLALMTNMPPSGQSTLPAYGFKVLELKSHARK